MDIVARDEDGDLLVADIKTGNAVYDETSLQLAAYALAWKEMRGYASLENTRLLALHVRPEGVTEYEVADIPNATNSWLAALNLWRGLKETMWLKARLI